MTQDPQKADAASFRADAKSFRIVAIYDSSKASGEAARASAVVLRELEDEVEVDKSSWTLDALENDRIRDLAAGEAARADMIVIALSVGGVSAGLKRWVAQWESKRQVSGGLLALIPPEGRAESHDLEICLSEAAVNAQMDFLCPQRPRY